MRYCIVGDSLYGPTNNSCVVMGIGQCKFCQTGGCDPVINTVVDRCWNCGQPPMFCRCEPDDNAARHGQKFVKKNPKAL